MNKYNPCPCNSSRLYHKCCAPFHEGESPDNALKLMRSRYCAFALGLTEYLVRTTHPDNPERKDDEEVWRKDLARITEQARFDGLKVIEFLDGEDSASVTFTAFISRGDEDLSFSERSHFVKENETWLYKEGQIL